MDDLISRQAAIERIESHIRVGDELYPLTDTDKILNHAFEIAASCVYNLPSAQPEQRWIPCSERLPQPNEEEADGFIKAYLVQDGRWMDVARWNGDCWIAWGYGTALTNVIAWMPLPEPYKERRTDGSD